MFNVYTLITISMATITKDYYGFRKHIRYIELYISKVELMIGVNGCRECSMRWSCLYWSQNNNYGVDIGKFVPVLCHFWHSVGCQFISEAVIITLNIFLSFLDLSKFDSLPPIFVPALPSMRKKSCYSIDGWCYLAAYKYLAAIYYRNLNIIVLSWLQVNIF